MTWLCATDCSPTELHQNVDSCCLTGVAADFSRGLLSLHMIKPAHGAACCCCVIPVQDMCQLLWALGSCGYSPTGRALPAWLHTHVERLLWPTASSSSSLFPGISLESAVQLFVGLRRSKVVLSGQWLAALLDASEASAATLPLQVGTDTGQWLLMLPSPPACCVCQEN
jgi:hypothetical protein